MGAPFDHVAQNYDDRFTNSAVGQLQRSQVWTYLENLLPELGGLDILELNCGTGEDAVMFGQKGFNVVATDVSAEMLKVTESKAERLSMQHRISSRYLDLDNLDDLVFERKFDFIFSNFGGLNCISPESMHRLLRQLPELLKPHGRFVAVIMPRFCLWESFYFLGKLKFAAMFRRLSRRGTMANLHGIELQTWYYSPGQISSWSREFFLQKRVLPVGITLPPSFLNTFFHTRRRLLAWLFRIEQKIAGIRFLATVSDHYIIDLQLR